MATNSALAATAARTLDSISLILPDDMIQREQHTRAPGGIAADMRLLGLDPLQEAVHRTLMRLYARQGRRGAALKQYQVCVGVLQRELGTTPEAETRKLYQELLRRPAEAVQVSDARGDHRTPRAHGRGGSA
jgi:hypothetical protein